MSLVHMFRIHISTRVIGENEEKCRCKEIVIVHCCQASYSAENSDPFHLGIGACCFTGGELQLSTFHQWGPLQDPLLPWDCWHRQWLSLTQLHLPNDGQALKQRTVFPSKRSTQVQMKSAPRQLYTLEELDWSLCKNCDSKLLQARALFMPRLHCQLRVAAKPGPQGANQVGLPGKSCSQ